MKNMVLKFSCCCYFRLFLTLIFVSSVTGCNSNLFRSETNDGDETVDDGSIILSNELMEGEENSTQEDYIDVENGYFPAPRIYVDDLIIDKDSFCIDDILDGNDRYEFYLRTVEVSDQDLNNPQQKRIECSIVSPQYLVDIQLLKRINLDTDETFINDLGQPYFQASNRDLWSYEVEDHMLEKIGPYLTDFQVERISLSGGSGNNWKLSNGITCESYIDDVINSYNNETSKQWNNGNWCFYSPADHSNYAYTYSCIEKEFYIEYSCDCSTGAIVRATIENNCINSNFPQN